MGYSYDNSPNTAIVYASSIHADRRLRQPAPMFSTSNPGETRAPPASRQSISMLSHHPLRPCRRRLLCKICRHSNLGQLGRRQRSCHRKRYRVGIDEPCRSAVSERLRASVSANYTNSGGERFYVQFGIDPTAQNFLYDVWVNMANPSSSVANLEIDLRAEVDIVLRREFEALFAPVFAPPPLPPAPPVRLARSGPGAGEPRRAGYSVEISEKSSPAGDGQDRSASRPKRRSIVSWRAAAPPNSARPSPRLRLAGRRAAPRRSRRGGCAPTRKTKAERLALDPNTQTDPLDRARIMSRLISWPFIRHRPSLPIASDRFPSE